MIDDRRRAKIRDAGSPISPELKSWIDNVIVPALIDEFLAAGAKQKAVADAPLPDVSSRSMSEPYPCASCDRQ